jgi:dehydrodolichyl diphosphate syntase complex subunit NUS1
MNLLLLSASDGRETLVDLTKSLAEMSQSGRLSLDDIGVELIDAKISEMTWKPSQPIPALDDVGPSSNHSNCSYTNPAERSPLLYSVKPEPDFLFILGPCIKLDGYPPWQIRLTEIFCMGEKSSTITGRRSAVKYQLFLRGLRQYAGSQMRFGR